MCVRTYMYEGLCALALSPESHIMNSVSFLSADLTVQRSGSDRPTVNFPGAHCSPRGARTGTESDKVICMAWLRYLGQHAHCHCLERRWN